MTTREVLAVDRDPFMGVAMCRLRAPQPKYIQKNYKNTVKKYKLRYAIEEATVTTDTYMDNTRQDIQNTTKYDMYIKMHKEGWGEGDSSESFKRNKSFRTPNEYDGLADYEFVGNGIIYIATIEQDMS